MANNPYAVLARVSGFLGNSEANEIARAAAGAYGSAANAARRGGRTANALVTGGRRAVRSGPRSGAGGAGGSGGGPRGPRSRVGGAGGPGGFGGGFNLPYLPPRPMRIRQRTGPGYSAIIDIDFPSNYASHMDDADLAELRRWGAKIEREMRSLSRGRLSYKDLRRLGHPYGHGQRRMIPGSRVLTARNRRAGFAKMDAVNRHTGNFEQSWRSSARFTRTGANLRIENRARYASALMTGTRRMKAHGPFTAVPAAYRTRLAEDARERDLRAFQRRQSERAGGAR